MELTIITINKDDLEGLKRTVASVFCQTYTNFEYIIIDGDSSDGSASYVEKIADRLSYSISEQDKGVYSAMNKGIKKAKGKYLMFLNSGDTLYSPDVLMKVFRNASDADVLHGRVVLTSPLKPEYRKNAPSNSQLTTTYFLYDTIYHQGSFIRRSVFEKYGFYDENYSIISDWVMFLKLAKNKHVFDFKDVDIAYFEAGGISSTNPDLVKKEKLAELKKAEYGQLYQDFIEINRLKSSLVSSKEFSIVKSNKLISLQIRMYLRYHYYRLKR